MKRTTAFLAALGIAVILAVAVWRLVDVNQCSRDGGVWIGGIAQQAYCAETAKHSHDR